MESVMLRPQALIDSLSMHCHVTDIFIIVAVIDNLVIVVIVDMLMIIGAYNHDILMMVVMVLDNVGITLPASSILAKILAINISIGYHCIKE